MFDTRIDSKKMASLGSAAILGGAPKKKRSRAPSSIHVMPMNSNRASDVPPPTGSLAFPTSSSLTTNTLKGMEVALAKSKLELVPSKGEFLNYIVDTTYVLSFTVRNRSNTTQMLRFLPPQKVLNFRLVDYQAVRLAPGLARVIDVEFSTHEEGDFEDSWTILTERGYRVPVPLIAVSVPALEIDSLIDFGRVEQKRADLLQSLTLKNKGRRDALVTLSVPMEAMEVLSVSPSSVIAKAMGETQVQVRILKLPSIGKCQWVIDVTIEEEDTPRKVKVVADVVDCRSHLIDLQTGSEAASVQFRRVYAGAKEKRQLMMINGSEGKVSFAFQLSNELVAKEAPPFRFTPEQGTLGPKEKCKVTVMFEPPMNPIRKGWSHSPYQNPGGDHASSAAGSSRTREVKKFEGLFSLVFVETEETHNFYLVGESSETHAVISRTSLDFGICALNDYRHEVIDIRNEVLELPLTFSFDRVAHFKVDPSSGTIPPGGKEVVTIMFRPHGPGRFHKQFKILLNHTVVRSLSVCGTGVVDLNFVPRPLVGGVHALPEDFRLSFQPPGFKRSLLANKTGYHKHDEDDQGEDEGRSTAYGPTEAASGAAVYPPTAADIGMIPGEGLRPPQPSLRIPQKELRAEDEANRAPSTHVGPMTFDVKSLIRRCFNEVPANAVERRDCRRELLPMDLIKIVAPIKTLQFDRITIGTVAVRPFYLFNGTNASIVVKMPPDDLYPDLHFSPHSQVIPQGRMAAFDVSLCSQKVQTCQQVVNFTVNHQYPMRLFLHAEVVPVEVTLSYDAVILSFSEFTDAPVTMSTVTLSNQGSYEATYWWKLPPHIPFSIDPAEGKIPPLSKEIAHITFSPVQGVFTSTCDAFLVVEGAAEEKTLRLTGIVEQTHCTWTKMLLKSTGEAQVDLRRIPAGKTSSLSIYIANIGQRNAFFSFEALPDWLTITPSCGRVSAGETEDLLLSVKSDKAENLSQLVYCYVRGMKRPLKMHLTANVVAPPITVSKGVLLPRSGTPGGGSRLSSSSARHVSPSTFGNALRPSSSVTSAQGFADGKPGEFLLHFGEVFYRHEKRLAVHIRNTGDIAAVVTVDLRHCHPEGYIRWKNAKLYPDSGVATNDQEWETFIGGAAASIPLVEHAIEGAGAAIGGTSRRPSATSVADTEDLRPEHSVRSGRSSSSYSVEKERNESYPPSFYPPPPDSKPKSVTKVRSAASFHSGDQKGDEDGLASSAGASTNSSHSIPGAPLRETLLSPPLQRRGPKQGIIGRGSGDPLGGLYHITIEPNREEIVYFCYCPLEYSSKRGGSNPGTLNAVGGSMSPSKGSTGVSQTALPSEAVGSYNNSTSGTGTGFVRRRTRMTSGGSGGSPSASTGIRVLDVASQGNGTASPVLAGSTSSHSTAVGDKRRYRILWKQIGADEVLHPLPPLIVEAEAMPPMIEISRLLLRFPTTVAGKMAGVKPQTLELRNLCREAVRWGIQSSPEASAQANDQFLITPSSGVIPPMDTTMITVNFLGSEEGRFCGVFQVYVEQATPKPCASFTVLGIATRPRLLVEKPFLIFPAVPLGVTIRDVIHIVNDGFDAIQLEYKGESGPLVQVNFPKGQQLTNQTWRLPVEFLFSSQKPVTLLSSILISSSKGENVEIHLCATALNSLLTTAPFLQYREPYSTIAPASLLHSLQTSESSIGKKSILTKKSLAENSKKGSAAVIKNNYTNLVSEKDFSPFIFFDKKGSAGITIVGSNSCYGSGMNGSEIHKKWSSTSTRKGVPTLLGLPSGFSGMDGTAGGLGGGHRGLEALSFEMIDTIYRTLVNIRVTVEMLTRWFNTLLLRTPVENIVEAMAQSHGSILSDCIFRLCGRRPAPVARSPSRKGSAAGIPSSTPNRPSSMGDGSHRRGKKHRGSVTFTSEEGVKRKEAMALGGAANSASPMGDEMRSQSIVSQTGERISLKDGGQGERLSPSIAGGVRRASVLWNTRGSRQEPVPSLSSAGGSSHGAMAMHGEDLESARRLKGELMLQGILEFLSSCGCCLHHVPAKYLLPFEEYVQASPVHHKVLSRELFKDRLYQSWMAVLTEAIRVFYFSKVTFSHFVQVWKPMSHENYPCMDPSESGWIRLKQSLTESNVYSSSESILLFWIRSCVEFFASSPGSPFATAQKIRVSCFTDLRDPRVLIAVVLVYCPALYPLFFSGEKNVVLNPTSPVDHEINASLLFHALSELALPQLPSPRMYLEFSQLSFALFASILLAYLPKFIASQSISFEGKLLSPISRTIQVHNSSQKTRMYRVWMENPLFQPNQKELVVGGQSTAELEIVFMPRYHRVVEGRCLLIDQSSLTLGEHVPLVFSLRAAPNMEPTKIIEISTCLYEPLSQDILVENPFPHDCVVSVRVQQGSSEKPTTGAMRSASTLHPAPATEMGGTHVPQRERGVSQDHDTSSLPPSAKTGADEEGRRNATALPPILTTALKTPMGGTSMAAGTKSGSGGGVATTMAGSTLEGASAFPSGATNGNADGRDGQMYAAGMSATVNGEESKSPSSYLEGFFFSSQIKRQAFFIHTDVLPLRQGDAAKLPMHFLPLVRGVYTVKITFRDEREGEFSYEVRGTCKDPKPSEIVDCRAEVGESSTSGFTIRSSNPALEKTIRLVEEKCRQLHLEITPIAVDWKNNVYTVEFLNENFEGPNPFFTPAALENDEDEGRGKQNGERSRSTGIRVRDGHPQDRKGFATSRRGSATSMGEASYRNILGSANSSYVIRVENANNTSFPFKFTPKVAGRYPGLIRLTSPIDVRVIRVHGECVTKGQQRILRFHCPARQFISQNIAITNRSEEEWLMSATIEGAYFSGGKDLRVPPGKSKEYAIRYAPPWITEEKKKDMGLLVLRNGGTGQTHKYTLIGEADPPLSEDHLIVDCRAREQRAVLLTIPNVTNHDCTYFTETDLPFTEGESTVVIPRDSFAKYTLNFLPAVGGTYVGQIVFKSHQGPYVWFGVTLVVSPPEKEGTIEIKTNVRTSVEVDVTLRNPANKSMSFFVRRAGSGLYGENYLEVGPKGTAIYTCIFVPTRAGEMKGRLSFCNDEVGEFWYDVHMQVEESSPEDLVFTTTLGETSTATVKLTNTSEQECALQTTNTNPANFFYSPSLLIIPPMKDLPVNIVYKPTCVGELQEGELTFTHHKAGQWKYSAKGTGLPPLPFSVTKCVCPIGSSTSFTLSFVNSLDVETPMVYSFSVPSSSPSSTHSTANPWQDTYFSLKRAPDGPVAPGGTVTMIILYSPRVVGHHQSVLEVRPAAGELHQKYRVCWSFPIEGNAEWRETTTPFRFKCTARKNHEEVIILPAPGLTVEDKKEATIRFEPDPNQHYLAAINSSFMCSLEDPEEEEGAGLPDAFRARIRFTPLRSMVSSGDLLVRGASGGSWRYRVYLEASPAPPDDVIQMSTAYKSCSTVVFDLYNVFSYKSKFAAFFTNDSSKDFEVSPTHGVLLPFIPNQKNASSATAIRLYFRPSTRVPQVEGTLVVDTEDMQWSFKVVGRLDREKGPAKKT